MYTGGYKHRQGRYQTSRYKKTEVSYFKFDDLKRTPI